MGDRDWAVVAFVLAGVFSGVLAALGLTYCAWLGLRLLYPVSKAATVLLGLLGL